MRSPTHSLSRPESQTDKATSPPPEQPHALAYWRLLSILRSHRLDQGTLPVASDRQKASPCNASPQQTTDFLVMAGGGAPDYNEIALEKNVLYFQRTLRTLGFDPAEARLFFANGNDGQATIRYLDAQRQERFKVPEIPNLQGAATLSNFQNWLQQKLSQGDRRPTFFYFTGHGQRNPENADNNAMILWGEDLLSVQDFTSALDQLPAVVPVVTMMSQCYSGSFANMIYEGGNPRRPVAPHTRCGFFATIQTRPSVGCTPEVNEADYEDYSSSFFAGLSGQSRTGQPVASADYNQDGRVAYAEAHAFAKIDEQTSDLPLSTLEAWLQRQTDEADYNQIFNQPIAQWSEIARPERKAVVTGLGEQLKFDLRRSLNDNLSFLQPTALEQKVAEAYIIRLGMELVNIAVEQQIHSAGNAETITVLDRLMECEAGSWQ